jgi:tetratricopeptide (TPR) repeat protein
MWSGLLSIGRTAKRTWAMDAVDVARTAASSGSASPSPALSDGLGFTTEAIADARATGDPALLLEVLTIGSLHFAAVGSLPDVMRPLNAEAGALAESLGNPWHVAMAEALRGMTTYVAGDLVTSMQQLRSAVEALRRLGDDTTAALFEISFSEVAELRGDIAGATSAMAAALEINDECGFRSATVLRAVLCWLTGRNGERERSLQLGQEVVALAHQPFNPVIRAQALFALGAAETWADMTDEADGHLREALAIHERVGMMRETAMDHRHLGIVRRRLGDPDAAMKHLRTALELAVEVGLPWTVMLVARSMARVVVGTDSEMAARLLGNTEAVSDLFGYLPTPDERELVDGILSAATDDIGDKAVAAAVAEGAQLSYTDLPALFASS